MIEKTTSELSDDHVDDHVDEEIIQCFTANPPKSFFMFAGAGSGKTRSLINALAFLDKEFGYKLSTYGRRIGVITYTNAACNEISRRLHYKPIFFVSTIHSFLWELIKNYQLDIKEWVSESLKADIAELQEKQAKGRSGDAALKRAKEIQQKTTRLEKLGSVIRFFYNPNGDNIGYDSLNHSEVIKMGSNFLATEETMQDVLINKFPILLIDESQDTKKDLVDALLTVQDNHKLNFCVGMFGDTMQKIYTDGKENLALCVPADWQTPKKIMNHRSSKRIVELANSIRSGIDKEKQQPRSSAITGTVCLFIVNSNSDKELIEQKVAETMAEKTGDENWYTPSTYQKLILEHHMAASRFGFKNLYTPLNESGAFDTSLRNGSIPELSLLANVVSPIITAYKAEDDFGIAKIIRKYSPLLSKKALQVNKQQQLEVLTQTEHAVESLMTLFSNGRNATCLEVLKVIKKANLLDLGSRLESVLAPVLEGEDKKITALRTALSADFGELERYYAYATDQTQFATHQGVKGLEFPRVMVIMDDAESKGFLFSYEKLFGVTPKTETDLKNERDGKDTSISRTTRLFYVACTRAEKSLAVIAYTENPDAVQKTAMTNGWFKEEEIEYL